MLYTLLKKYEDSSDKYFRKGVRKILLFTVQDFGYKSITTAQAKLAIPVFLDIIEETKNDEEAILI